MKLCRRIRQSFLLERTAQLLTLSELVNTGGVVEAQWLSKPLERSLSGGFCFAVIILAVTSRHHFALIIFAVIILLVTSPVLAGGSLY